MATSLLSMAHDPRSLSLHDPPLWPQILHGCMCMWAVLCLFGGLLIGPKSWHGDVNDTRCMPLTTQVLADVALFEQCLEQINGVRERTAKSATMAQLLRLYTLVGA